MEKKEAIWILENGAWWDSLPDDMSDADKNPLLAAIDIAIAALKMPETGEPLTQADIDQMDYEKIWIEYKDGTGEWALVYAGKIYGIDALEGAGLGDMLQDAMQGERLDWPTGQYVAYRQGKEHNCGVHGCAVIREAAQRLEELLKYKTAIDRMGQFGQLFVEYEGCPRGAMGRMCDATIQEEALAMDMLTDVDMGRWRPVNEDVLQDLLRKAVIETGKEQKNEEPAHIDRKAWEKPCKVGDKVFQQRGKGVPHP